MRKLKRKGEMRKENKEETEERWKETWQEKKKINISFRCLFFSFSICKEDIFPEQSTEFQ